MIAQRLAELGLTLPVAAAPVAAYVPTVQVGDMLYVSGQLPFIDGVLVTGKIAGAADLAQGQAAAKACALMTLAQVEKAIGSLDRVQRIVKLGVFVSSTADFTDQPKVANGASDLMEAVFGDAGKHARSAVSVPVLPLDAMVEIDAVVMIRV